MSEYIKSVRSLRSVADAYRSMKDPRSLNDKVEEQLIESIIQDVQTEEDDLFRVDTLNIVNQYLNEFPSDLQEGAIKDIIMDFEDGVSDMKISKSRGIDIKVIKGLKKDWLGIQKKHQQLAASYNEENLQEGTWAIPDTPEKLKKLQKALMKPVLIKREKDLDKAAKVFTSYVGDDGVMDVWYKMMLDYEDVKKVGDAREPVIDFLKQWGVKLSGYKITHAPGSWVSGFDDDDRDSATVEQTQIDEEQEVEEGFFANLKKKFKGRGKIKKPTGKDKKQMKVEGRRPPSKMSGSKLTGQEISVYFRKNPKAKSNAIIKKAVEIALDHGGAMNYAIDKIQKLKKGLEKNSEVKKALQFANEERTPFYKGFELVVQEELSRRDEIKLGAYGVQLAKITNFKWEKDKSPEVAIDRLFGQIRSKGKYSPAGWEKIHKMVAMLDKIGVKLPSLKGFYMGMDKKTGKGIFHEDILDTIADIKEGIEEIVEAQTMNDADIKKIAKMTDRNDHTGSLMHLAKLLGDKKGLEALKGIMMTHKAIGHMPDGLMKTRNQIHDNLMRQSKSKYRNHKDVISSF
tara:strand:- start:15915 stop:17624 length:1710 start_codon:yes stop_codon:yes gene_type:complete